MTNFEAHCKNIARLLAKNEISVHTDYSLFSRPGHLIIETHRDNRQEILDILRTEYEVIENDDWCSGCRLGIIIPNMWDVGGRTK